MDIFYLILNYSSNFTHDAYGFLLLDRAIYIYDDNHNI